MMKYLNLEHSVQNVSSQHIWKFFLHLTKYHHKFHIFLKVKDEKLGSWHSRSFSHSTSSRKTLNQPEIGASSTTWPPSWWRQSLGGWRIRWPRWPTTARPSSWPTDEGSFQPSTNNSFSVVNKIEHFYLISCDLELSSAIVFLYLD